MRARFGYDALDPVRMAAIDPRIRVSFIQKLGVAEEIVEPSASSASGEARVCRGVARRSPLFNVKDPDL
jgi:hypothetical protein